MATLQTENEIPISPPWIELPGDVTANILKRLGAEEVLKSAEKVCTTCKNVCMDPAMWRVVHLIYQCGDEREFDLMCRCAVDRSRGQLVDLRIIFFGGDELLNYVAHRCSDLRFLLLTSPSDLSRIALTEAVKNLPRLEELHLIKVLLLDGKDVETIGISCPLLKSFTYSAKGHCSYEENVVALAIAKSMPNLHHLRLLGNGMKNEGLEAILDGCPHLELLNVRDCYNLDLKAGALGKRCSKQIKDVSLPIELPIEDDILHQLRIPIEIPDEILDVFDSIMAMDSDGDYDYGFYD